MKAEEPRPNIRLPEEHCLANVVIILAIVLGIGVYLIATTVLIAEDSTLYIECAKQIADDPVEGVRNMQLSPGYPFLIYLTHKVTGLFNDTESIQRWIISAQAVSLLSKVIASLALYFVGSYFVGPNLSFWGVLILSILPDSAKLGSDALTEWPHLMFLTTGFLLLLLGAQYRKNWMFGWAGIIAGLGYLVRSEGCQLIVYGSAWLLFNLVRPQGKTKRTKAAGALILLLAGFAIIAVPYMRSKGCVFPKQRMWKLPASLSFSNDSYSPVINANICLAGLSIKGVIGNETLITNMCETLMYYFIPPLLIGCYYYFRKQSKRLEQTFFAAAFIIFNVVMLSWQSNRFLSRRHTLALVAFTIFYIPIGLHTIACWLSERSPKNDVAMQKNKQHWFFVLLIIGIVICLPKLLRPMRIDKQGYLDAAVWLKENTKPEDIIAVPDKRISFYAERKGRAYDKNVPKGVKYIVKIVKGGEKPKVRLAVQEKCSAWIGRRGKRKRVIIYEVL
ncbi:MAG: glycosyltransferase family 39 protein [Planctomycetes bacterium]|nr:glycosyltransferase family 39 protein [Planctomycetota bacterium]